MMTEIIVPVSFFALVLGIIYLAIRKKERLAMMEKGVDPSTFVTKKQTYPSLKWGMFLIGLGVGLIIANLLVKNYIMDEHVAYFSMVFLFGGIALVISYFVGKKQAGNEE
ncbi:MAG: hypothetical protein KAT48_14700 [Bacteroidales bacterium]|nr:hypothetical protein [Bacteroidales bacterium]